MAVAPDGSLSLPFDHLRTMISESAEFQSWVGAANPTEAKASIHMLELPAPADKQHYTRTELDGLRPFALIGWPRGTGLHLRRVAGGSDLTFLESQPLYVAFEDKLDSAENVEDNFFTFTNHVGKVMVDMTKLAGTADFLAIKDLTVDDFWRSDPDEITDNGDFWWLRVLLEWDV